MTSNAPRESAPQAFDLIGTELTIAIEELFEDYKGGVRAESSPPTLEGELALASIGFTSEQMRGSLSILATKPVVRVLQRAFMDDDDDSVLESTIGEYSNMLLGRLKNRVLSHGIIFKMATPTSAMGVSVHLATPEPPMRASWFSFVSADVTVVVRFDVVFEPGFQTDGDKGRTAISEGTVLIFDLSERKAA